ncbi:ATP-dependent RNA helicase [Halomonas cupida]|uniref:ATP-dependent RNA helicase n=1 Tax=Halomonas cupida TaxID=44933 RepID=A0A1M7FA59_9GAMM|nr:ATP-dependent RNA helicase DbpA [Halomonas cupida]GEN23471.1 ATP-dependent RNA helicase [Halomonas cupida]SHM00964.1 ATP-dependent RNA helicase DbpA [Halomonas cupida]
MTTPDTNHPRDFQSLPLSQPLLTNLEDLGYAHLTEIQAAALPAIMEGRDVIGQARTGSGKTVTFGLGLLHKLQVEQFRVQALVLCPTRELADQVARELRKLARTIPNIKILTLCGGMPFGPQVGSLKHGAHIVVGTPGRIDDHLRKGNLDLSEVQALVLDEADRMLDMGFQAVLDQILAELPQQRQTLLFSATYPKTIDALAARVLRNPVKVEVSSPHTQSTIEQKYYRVENNEERPAALYQLLANFDASSVLVFCNTRKDTDEAAQALKRAGFSALALHGDMEQKDRDCTLALFANGSASILVATDVAARGLDIEELPVVVNYHLSRDPEVHVHRIGRTGRAGQKGVALSLVSKKEIYKLERLEESTQQPITLQEVPPLPRDFVASRPVMSTLQIDGGKKQKVRAGDVVGALTGEGGIDGTQIGKIQLFDFSTFVAVEREVAKKALGKLANGKLKGRRFRARIVGV